MPANHLFDGLLGERENDSRLLLQVPGGQRWSYAQLVELSGLIAMNARSFMAGQGHLSDARIGRYWSACRRRFDRWAKKLRDFAASKSMPGRSPAFAWEEVYPTLEEIFTGEILTRDWTAVACEFDRRRGSSCVSPVVRSVVLGHMQARNRALNVILRASEGERKQVLQADRLRRRSERWTYMLLACLLPQDRSISRVLIRARPTISFTLLSRAR